MTWDSFRLGAALILLALLLMSAGIYAELTNEVCR